MLSTNNNYLNHLILALTAGAATTLFSWVLLNIGKSEIAGPETFVSIPDSRTLEKRFPGIRAIQFPIIQCLDTHSTDHLIALIKSLDNEAVKVVVLSICIERIVIKGPLGPYTYQSTMGNLGDPLFNGSQGTFPGQLPTPSEQQQLQKNTGDEGILDDSSQNDEKSQQPTGQNTTGTHPTEPTIETELAFDPNPEPGSPPSGPVKIVIHGTDKPQVVPLDATTADKTNISASPLAAASDLDKKLLDELLEIAKSLRNPELRAAALSTFLVATDDLNKVREVAILYSKAVSAEEALNASVPLMNRPAVKALLSLLMGLCTAIGVFMKPILQTYSKATMLRFADHDKWLQKALEIEPPPVKQVPPFDRPG